jgi:hypothetical protein
LTKSTCNPDEKRFNAEISKLNDKRFTKEANKLFHKAQWKIYIDPARRKILCCGRRFGKTRLAIYECLRQIKINNSKCWIVAPTYSDVNEIYVDDMKLIMENELKWIEGTHYTYSKNLFSFINGSRIWLKSSDKQENLRGRGIDLIILDEFAIFLYKEKWATVYLPALNPGGKLIIISTPKGYDKFYELYDLGQKDNTGLWKSWQYSSYENTKLQGLIEDIEEKRKGMTQQEYEQEYLAMFNSSSKRASPQFNRDDNVTDLPIIFPEKQLRVGVDFNVDPMCWVVFQIIPKHILLSNPDFPIRKLQDEVVCYTKEFKLKNINTVGTIQELKKWLDEIGYYEIIKRKVNEIELTKLQDIISSNCIGTVKTKNEDGKEILLNEYEVVYKNYKEITFYGDSTGLYRDTAQRIDEESGKFITDWYDIERAFPNAYFENKTNPSHKNRINVTNGKIRNANGEIGLIISLKCENVIRDFEQAVQKQGSFSLDKSSYDPHFYDACTYPLYQEYAPDKKETVWYKI